MTEAEIRRNCEASKLVGEAHGIAEAASKLAGSAESLGTVADRRRIMALAQELIELSRRRASAAVGLMISPLRAAEKPETPPPE